MSNWGIYTVIDKLTDKMGPIFQQQNDVSALRTYEQMIQEKNIDKRDYCLYKLGTYDDEPLTMLDETRKFGVIKPCNYMVTSEKLLDDTRAKEKIYE